MRLLLRAGCHRFRGWSHCQWHISLVLWQDLLAIGKWMGYYISRWRSLIWWKIYILVWCLSILLMIEMLLDWNKRWNLNQRGAIVVHLVDDLSISFKRSIFFILEVNTKLLSQILELLQTYSSQSSSSNYNFILIGICSDHWLNMPLLPLWINNMDPSITYHFLLWIIINSTTSMSHIYCTSTRLACGI